MPTILITSMGGAGSNNLVDTLRLIDEAHGTPGKHKVVGTHFEPFELAKSEIEASYLVPLAANADDYIEAHRKICAKHNVDVLIANSDKEVAVWSKQPARIPAKHLIPIHDQVEMVQDKYKFFEILQKHGCQTVPNIPVTSIEAVDKAIAQLPKSDRFWIRMRNGSGSLGATWLHTAEQARKWMSLWGELRGIPASEFVVAPFLPGRDFCISTVWQNGEFGVGKIYERLVYWAVRDSLSGMGSSPDSARTINETWPIEAAKAAIRAVCAEFGTKPHGFYQCDLKCSDDRTAYVTEVNIGRFPQTSTHFDRVGKYKLLELYLQLILEPDKKLPRDVYDLVDNTIILRGIDMPVKFVTRQQMEALEKKRI